MKYTSVKPKLGLVVQITSCLWYVWTGEKWKKMTVQEQIAYSR